ncbi:hypothetical protein PC110_g8559 [Phytophthora cactorum]|uniref:Uncharacterized protein n=1 Tax=Phytophthora cactorum TaxID=29920 RepID=A0A329SGC0_9STRA|nr:hypothetical protein PC113_g8704 [Phytophthora cactorum]KAG3027214.1 hypothetical protein PC120_g5512 [Phytophthora cactorum]KAG3078680.1 hypothetical protein PC121_g7173 [Phytophthora cactorum]KAG3088979.1 hypothetical protein PC122_g8092 [Phytophthora cactorum]RAW35146.1 hypothetical protein PC110_g8559 [Phytophthora cactorum]
MDTVGENAYGAAIQSHPNCVVTINLNRLKTFGGRWSRPFPSEVPEGLNILPEAFDDGPLAEDDVPPTSYVERLTIGDEETALSGKALWQSRTTLLPTCAALIQMLEDVRRRDEGLPELHRSARLAEANAAVDEEELLV